MLPAWRPQHVRSFDVLAVQQMRTPSFRLFSVNSGELICTKLKRNHFTLQHICHLCFTMYWADWFVLSKYERDRDKWSRPTLISLPERQGIGKLSTLRLRGRNPGKRSGNTPRSRITRCTLFLFCFFFSGNASAYILFAVTGRTQASVNNNSDLQIEVYEVDF